MTIAESESRAWKIQISHYLLSGVLTSTILLTLGWVTNVHFFTFASIAVLVISGIIQSVQRQNFLSMALGMNIAIFTFLLLPSLYFYALTAEGYYRFTNIINFYFNRDDLMEAVQLIAQGYLLLSAGMAFKFNKRIGTKKISTFERRPTLLLLVFYGASSAVLLFMALSTDNPTDFLLSGVGGLLIAISGLAAAYLARGLGIWVWMAYLPALLAALLSSNRGSFLAVAALAVFAQVRRDINLKKMILLLAGGYFIVALASGELLEQRAKITYSAGVSMSATQRLSSEAIMVPTMALMVRELKRGALDYQNGIDFVLTPAFLIPRSIWPDKPIPLDFRLNNELRLNNGTTFGTPVSLFGGIYINLGPYLYLIGMFCIGLLVSKYAWTSNRVVSVLLFTFGIDLIRVGDISREVTTLLLWLGAYILIKLLSSIKDQRRLP